MDYGFGLGLTMISVFGVHSDPINGFVAFSPRLPRSAGG